MKTLNAIKQLLQDIHKPILSLYLHVDPALRENQAAIPAWRIWSKNALNNLVDRTTDQQNALAEILPRVKAFIEGYTPTNKSLVLFFGQDIRQMYEVSSAVKNYIFFGNPALVPLLRAFDEAAPFLLIDVTYENAVLSVTHRDGFQYQLEINIDIPRDEWREMTLMPATAAGGFIRAGSHRDRFEDRIEEQQERFYKEIAEEVATLRKKHPVKEIVLAGGEKAAHSVHKYLPETTIIGPIALAGYLSPAEILAKVVPIVREHRLADDVKLVQETLELDRSGGRAARGTAVLDAMKQHRVELLILPLISSGEALVNSLCSESLIAGSQIKVVTGTAAEYLVDDSGVAARLYY